MTKNQRYRYRQLADPSHIRLASIIQRPGPKKIHLKVETVPIEEVVGQYEAVSYMWGDATNTRDVTIEDKTLTLRYNIWRCLKHLRDNEMTTSKLWIDSICINQSDDEEKSVQVAKMAEIFRSASRVLIWLGSTSLQTYLVPPGKDSLVHSIEELPPKDLDVWVNVLGYSHDRSQSLENQIMSIVYNPYWQRVWILQEVSLARQANIVFGKAFLDQTCFFAMLWAARENSKPGYRTWIARQRDPDIREFGTGILDSHPLMHGYRNQSDDNEDGYHARHPFDRLMAAVQHKHCTDPRDYVFGVASLVRPHRVIEVDYRCSNEEVAFGALQALESERMESSPGRGLDLFRAVALLKALEVTSSTYSVCLRNLCYQKAELMQATKFHFSLGFLVALYGNDDASLPEEEAYDDVVQLNVSGSLMKNVYQMKRQETLAIKLTDGQIKRLAHLRDGDVTCPTSDVLLLCTLGEMPAVVVRLRAGKDRRTTVEHLVWPDTSRRVEQTLLYLDIELPKHLKVALQREINSCSLEWNSSLAPLTRLADLQLSILELASLSELIPSAHV